MVFNIRNSAIHCQLLRNIINIIGRDMCVDRQVDETLFFGYNRKLTLLLTNSLVEHFQIHIVSDRLHMSVLLRSENVACSSDFEITHGNMEARTELGIFTDSRKSLCGNLGQLLASPECKICACTP